MPHILTASLIEIFVSRLQPWRLIMFSRTKGLKMTPTVYQTCKIDTAGDFESLLYLVIIDEFTLLAPNITDVSQFLKFDLRFKQMTVNDDLAYFVLANVAILGISYNTNYQTCYQIAISWSKYCLTFVLPIEMKKFSAQKPLASVKLN